MAAYVGTLPTIVVVLEDNCSFWRSTTFFLLATKEALAVEDAVGVGKVNSGRDDALVVTLISEDEVVEQGTTAVVVMRPTTVIVVLTETC